MSNITSLVKFDMEKLDERINFGLCQVQVNGVLIQAGLHKTLKGRLGSSSKESSSDMGLEKSNGGSKASNMSNKD